MKRAREMLDQTNHNESKQWNMTSEKVDARTRFVARRAAMLGQVCRKDIIAAFGLSQAQASRTLSEAVECERGFLRKSITNRHVEAIPGAKRPGYASLTQITHDLVHGKGFAVCGVMPSEIKIVIHPNKPLEINENIMEKLLSAARAGDVVSIKYAGMKRGEVAAARKILPWSVELHNKQWYCVAWDLEKCAKRTFLLARVHSIDVLPPSIINKRKVAEGKAAMTVMLGREAKAKRFKVMLNPELTPDQIRGVERELGAKGGIVEVSEYEMFWFLRHYADQPIEEGVVWPPIVKMDEILCT